MRRSICIRFSLFLAGSTQPNRQRGFAHFDAGDIRKEVVFIRCAFALADDVSTMLRDRLGHGPLDLGGRNTDNRAGWRFGRSAQIRLRHVISISQAVLGRMGRDHAVASRIEQEPSERSSLLFRVLT